jgi:glutamate synthase (NADPH/NADH) small chain
VVVVGGGNTAMDAANAALKLGAESVTIAYRRDRDSMPAFEHEYEFTHANGVQFEWNARPARIVGKSGHATGLRCVRTRQAGGKRDTSLKDLEGSEFTIPADMVIKALGQEPIVDLLRANRNLKLDKRHRILINRESGATSVPKLFAGGDCAAGQMEEVVGAVQAGKTAARGIHAALTR